MEPPSPNFAASHSRRLGAHESMAAARNTIMLCLIQSGESAWEAENRVHGVTDLPLSETGRTALVEDAQHLRCDHVAIVHHPPDEAASDTAHIMARRLNVRTK